MDQLCHIVLALPPHINTIGLAQCQVRLTHLACPAAGGVGFRERLAGLGLAGVVAYGLLNTLYYTAAFYFVWNYVAHVPRGAMSLLSTTAPADYSAMQSSVSTSISRLRSPGAGPSTLCRVCCAV